MESYPAFLRIIVTCACRPDRGSGDPGSVSEEGSWGSPCSLRGSDIKGGYLKGFMAFKSKACAWKDILSPTQVHRSG